MNDRPNTFFHQCAKASWAAFAVIIVFGFVMRSTGESGDPGVSRGLIHAGTVCLLAVLGCLAAFVGLIGMLRHGWRRLALPATSGLILNGGVMAFMAVSLLGVNSTPMAAAPDESVSVDQYLAAGLPSLDTVWTGAEFAEAASALRDVASNSPTRLPRRDSPVSGDVFDKFLDLQGVYAGIHEPFDVMVSSAQILDGLSALMSLYYLGAEVDGKRMPFNAEMASLQCAAYDVTAILHSKARIVVDDPNTPVEIRENLRGSWSQLGDGAYDMIHGTLTMLSTQRIFRPEDRLVVAACLARHAPQLSILIPEGRLAELEGLVKALPNPTKDQAVAEAYVRLSAALGD